LNATTFHAHRVRNLVHSVALIGAMGLLVGTIGWLLAGPAGAALAALMPVFSLLLNPAVSPAFVLRMHGARRLGPDQAPGLARVMEILAARAGLARVPALYHLPQPVINAFTLGHPKAAAIVITDGLLRRLSGREVTAVLAHEISHLRNGDIWVMGLADLFGRMTRSFSLLGQLLIIVNLPLMATGGMTISWPAVLLLVFAPGVSLLTQLALSRAREFDADLEAAALSGDPEGLALALAKIERYQRGLFERVFMPGGLPDRGLMRTHPPTRERIRRLRELVPAPAPPWSHYL
jgi:heat shock protein HtpX